MIKREVTVAPPKVWHGPTFVLCAPEHTEAGTNNKGTELTVLDEATLELLRYLLSGCCEGGCIEEGPEEPPVDEESDDEDLLCCPS